MGINTILMEREGLLAHKLYIICRVASPLGDGARGQLSLLPLLGHHEQALAYNALI